MSEKLQFETLADSFHNSLPAFPAVFKPAYPGSAVRENGNTILLLLKVSNFNLPKSVRGREADGDDGVVRKQQNPFLLFLIFSLAPPSALERMNILMGYFASVMRPDCHFHVFIH